VGGDGEDGNKAAIPHMGRILCIGAGVLHVIVVLPSFPVGGWDAPTADIVVVVARLGEPKTLSPVFWATRRLRL
jgi:hypothetical protein